MFLFVNLNVTLFHADMYFLRATAYMLQCVYGTAIPSICSSVCYTRGFYQTAQHNHRNSFTL